MADQQPEQEPQQVVQVHIEEPPPAHVTDPPPRPPLQADRALTRPQDWAPPARAYLFGNHTLSDGELVGEIKRHAAYGRTGAIEAVQREQALRAARRRA